jgi:hypothetical protein
MLKNPLQFVKVTSTKYASMLFICSGYNLTRKSGRVEAIEEGYFSNRKLRTACQDVHFTSIEDIYLKSSIPGESSILRVTGRSRYHSSTVSQVKS